MSTNEQKQKFDCLAVTHVEVFPFQEGPRLGHMKGLATVVLNDKLHIRGLRIMEGENGLFVGYPVDPFFKGEDFRHLVQPISRELREHIKKFENLHNIEKDKWRKERWKK